MKKKNAKMVHGNAKNTQIIPKFRKTSRFPRLNALPMPKNRACRGIKSVIDQAAPWIVLGPLWQCLHETGHWMAAWAVGWQPYAITFGIDLPRPIERCRWGNIGRWKIGRVWCRRRERGWKKTVFLLAGSLMQSITVFAAFYVLWITWHPYSFVGCLVWIWIVIILLTGELNAMHNLLWCPNRKDNFPHDGRRLCHRSRRALY